MNRLITKFIDWFAEIKLPITYWNPPNELEKKMERVLLDIYDKDPIGGTPVMTVGPKTAKKYKWWIETYWEKPVPPKTP